MFAKRLVLNIENQLVEINQSHPSWMRGLKLIAVGCECSRKSRIPRGCVD